MFGFESRHVQRNKAQLLFGTQFILGLTRLSIHCLLSIRLLLISLISMWNNIEFPSESKSELGSNSSLSARSHRTLTHPSHIGILGGGQLCMMMIEACHRLGLRVSVMDPNEKCSARNSAHFFKRGNFNDEKDIRDFVKESYDYRDILDIE